MKASTLASISLAMVLVAGARAARLEIGLKTKQLSSHYFSEEGDGSDDFQITGQTYYHSDIVTRISNEDDQHSTQHQSDDATEPPTALSGLPFQQILYRKKLLRPKEMTLAQAVIWSSQAYQEDNQPHPLDDIDENTTEPEPTFFPGPNVQETAASEGDDLYSSYDTAQSSDNQEPQGDHQALPLNKTDENTRDAELSFSTRPNVQGDAGPEETNRSISIFGQDANNQDADVDAQPPLNTVGEDSGEPGLTFFPGPVLQEDPTPEETGGNISTFGQNPNDQDVGVNAQTSSDNVEEDTLSPELSFFPGPIVQERPGSNEVDEVDEIDDAKEFEPPLNASTADEGEKEDAEAGLNASEQEQGTDEKSAKDKDRNKAESINLNITDSEAVNKSDSGGEVSSSQVNSSKASLADGGVSAQNAPSSAGKFHAGALTAVLAFILPALFGSGQVGM
ncbi:Hypothetical Protein FCC1311_040612 [Hondaea fermentalgiana]|uniref:Uncharacterized protein n=1 Tax=Hondaea fermentalgiana TaxID=2315210 RepID=A0A2R5GDP0_9STRA|nr:Hypothetical Protein FCC1311_040612 [Hondaea fermentalgiana]|eukprot:GBG27838.1 Hypothetical Protein FCC1311_040612 [Hondaea fermentalgiana]